MTEDNTPPNETNTSLLAEAEEGVTLEIPPAKDTSASLLTKRSNAKKSNAPRRETFVDSTDSTRLVLNRFDVDGDGNISQSEAALMAQANVLEEKEKKKYKQFLTIAIVLLVLTLTANFGLTIATIYLTRQFDVEDGTLVDRSTGKQVTTKTHGNLVAATLFGEVDGSGRLLNNNLCFATISMDPNDQDQTYADFLLGNPIRYTTTANGVSQNGQVLFMNQPQDMPDEEYFTFEFRDGFFEEVRAVVEEKEIDGATECVLFDQVKCETCPTLGETKVFFMFCCGTANQAAFDTGNCCLVGEEQLQRDMRRLGKCSQ